MNISERFSIRPMSAAANKSARAPRPAAPPSRLRCSPILVQTTPSAGFGYLLYIAFSMIVSAIKEGAGAARLTRAAECQQNKIASLLFMTAPYTRGPPAPAPTRPPSPRAACAAINPPELLWLIPILRHQFIVVLRKKAAPGRRRPRIGSKRKAIAICWRDRGARVAGGRRPPDGESSIDNQTRAERSRTAGGRKAQRPVLIVNKRAHARPRRRPRAPSAE
ncbi:hypothetical protein EVAR_30636_1 [Eumeta japonica]|uniref:Uncharacterized protein n=1 Tax=Eumeta variegata TaxID=151549 RepID=A0A4C1VPZ8_EUMVA|nr:hypothetical protein EVAR_30636_1 [Eumeta japonica]